MIQISAKDELNAIRATDLAVQRMLEKCDIYFSAAARATGRMEAERISGTGTRSRVEDYVCRMVDFQREAGLTAKEDELADMREQARRIIARMPQAQFRRVLELRYLQHTSWCWTWERIAQEMECPVRTVHRLHGWALLAYERAKTTISCG